jgi:hypothetical protein
MVRMVARACLVLSGLLVASLGGCGSGIQATSPPDAPDAAGGSGGLAGTGGGGTGGQPATATSAAPGVCVPGASVACACVSGQQGVQTCTSAGTIAACACAAPPVDAGGSGGADGAVTKPWDQGRVANAGTEWWVNAIQGVFFFSIKITNSYQADMVGRATVINFTEGMINKITPSTTAPASLLPASGEVTGWTYDQTSDNTKNGPVTATDFLAATNYIDGAAEPIFDTTRSYQPLALAWEVYANGPYHQMDVKVVQMASKADARTLYRDVLTFSQYAPQNIPWTQCAGSDPNPCGSPPNSIDPAALGQKYKFSATDLVGWQLDPNDPVAFLVLQEGTDTDLFSLIDGAADTYTNAGCMVTVYENLVGTYPQTATLYAMYFGTDAKATAFFDYEKTALGASNSIPTFDPPVASGYSGLVTDTVVAHFGAMFFKLIMSGFDDATSAYQQAAQLLAVLQSRTN